MKRFITSLFVIIIAATVMAIGQIPRQISWQGVLTDNNGSPLNGDYNVTVKLFSSDDQVNDLIPLWTEATQLTLTDGLVNLILGEDNQNPLWMDFNEQLWLEVSVDNDPPMNRIKIVSVPSSIISKTVEDSAIVAPKIKSGTVVRSIGEALGLTDHVRLVEGDNVTIEDNMPNPNDIRISALGDIKIEVNVDNSVSIFIKNKVTNVFNLWVIIFPNGNVWWFGPLIINNYIFVFDDDSDAGILIDPKDGISIFDENGNLVTKFNMDGTSEHHGLETYFGGIRVPLSNGGEILIDKDGLTIYDENGNILTDFLPDGTSYHKGRETFAGGIEIPTSSGGKIVIDETGITVYGEDGNIVSQIDDEGNSIHEGFEKFNGGLSSSEVLIPLDNGGVLIADGEGIVILGPNGDKIYEVKSDGTSYHKGMETFAGGIEVPIENGGRVVIDGNGFMIEDANGNPLVFIDKDGASFHYNTETFYQGINVYNSIIHPTTGDGFIAIGPEGIAIYGPDGSLVYLQDIYGNSYHAGAEEFAGGISIPTTDGGKVVINEDGIMIYDAEGNLLTGFDKDGMSYHTGKETYLGPIEANGGIEIPTASGGRIVIDEAGITVFNSDGIIVSQIDDEGNSIHEGFEKFNGGLSSSEVVIPLDNGGTLIADGEGIIIIGPNGEKIFEVTADGTSYHKGMETFAGGIEVPTSAGGNVVIDESGFRIENANGDPVVFIDNEGNSYHFSKETFYGGIDVENGIIHPTTGDGFIAIGPEGISIYGPDGSIVYHQDSYGNSYHAGVEEFAGGISIPTTDGGKVVINDGGIIIYDSEGNILTQFNKDGMSYHTGKETYLGPIEANGGIEIPTASGGKIVIDDYGITVYNNDGIIVSQIDDEGNSIHEGFEKFNGGLSSSEVVIPLDNGGTLIADGEGIIILGPNGDRIFEVAADGTSYHKGMETFAGGIEIPTETGGRVVIDQNGFMIEDETGEPVVFIDNNGYSYHYSRETFYEGIEVNNGIYHPTSGQGFITIGVEGITIYGPDGNLVYHQDINGNSYHAGFEEFAGGISIPTKDGGKVVIDENGIKIYDDSGVLLTGFDKDGTSYHTGAETYFGPIIAEGGIELPRNGGGKIILNTDGFEIKDEQEQIITALYSDGTNVRSGKETFGNGIETTELKVPLSTGGLAFINSDGFFIQDAEGTYLTIFDGLGESFHYGDEYYNGKINAEGGIYMPLNGGGRLSVDKAGIIFRDAQQNILSALKPDGTSFHTALETFTGGIEIPTIAEGKIRLDETGINIYDISGNPLTTFDSYGNSVHLGTETFKGLIEAQAGITVPLINGDGFASLVPTGLEFLNGEGNVNLSLYADGTSIFKGLSNFQNGIAISKSIPGDPYFYAITLIQDEIFMVNENDEYSYFNPATIQLGTPAPSASNPAQLTIEDGGTRNSSFEAGRQYFMEASQGIYMTLDIGGGNIYGGLQLNSPMGQIDLGYHQDAEIPVNLNLQITNDDGYFQSQVMTDLIFTQSIIGTETLKGELKPGILNLYTNDNFNPIQVFDQSGNLILYLSPQQELIGYGLQFQEAALNNLDVNNLTTDNLIVNNDAVFNGLTETQNLNVFGALNVTSDVTMSADLYVLGSVTATEYLEWSDKNLKRDFSIINNVNERLKNINGYYFYWKDDSKGIRRQLGLIAQEIESEFPELVTINESGFRTVNYPNFVAVLLMGLKEQQSKIDKLTSELDAYKNQVNDLQKVKDKSMKLEKELLDLKKIVGEILENNKNSEFKSASSINK